jgi:predicted transcriptional regulator
MKTNTIKDVILGKGLRQSWVAQQMGMNRYTLYAKLAGRRPFQQHELTKINAVLGTAFEGEKNGRERGG